jgi:hypothetical protein
LFFHWKNKNIQKEFFVYNKLQYYIPFIPDAQTLLTVVQTTDLDSPAPRAACLAGACPKLALSTFPKNTSCTSDGSTLALLRAATYQQKRDKHIFYKCQIQCNKNWHRLTWLPSIAIDPSLVAGTDERVPRNPPIGVRATPTMQTSVQNKLIRSTKTEGLPWVKVFKKNRKINVWFFFLLWLCLMDEINKYTE